MYAANKKVQIKENMVILFGSESDRNGSQNGLSSSPMKKYDSTKVTVELDIWSSILTQKNKDEASQSKPPPYIHPLVKNFKNYLSEKSLEICTEILGSETGSDGFYSSYTSFEDNNSKDGEKLKEKVNMVKKPRCFPPPLPSLFSQSQHGQSQPLKMRPHRDNGRLFLFLEVVSVPSHNFLAKRQNGRLILTFANDIEEEIANDFEEDKKCHSEITSIHSLELTMVNKTIGLVNQRPKCSKFNQVSKFDDVNIVQHGSLPRSLPMINGYEYYWRNKATGNVVPIIPNDQQNSVCNKVVVSRNINIYQGSNEASQDLQHLFVLNGKNKDQLVHNLRFCKDYRATRSFLLRDPCYIAT